MKPTTRHAVASCALLSVACGGPTRESYPMAPQSPGNRIRDAVQPAAGRGTTDSLRRPKGERKPMSNG